MRLILASASRGRKMLMEEWGVPFEVKPSDVDEPTGGFADPRSFVQTVAWSKAAATAANIDDGLIIAADTIAWLEGQPLLKPDDRAHAKKMLTFMSGKTHELWTGLVLWRRPGDRIALLQERSLVHLAPMQEQDIEKYLDERIWKGCSGAYAIQRPTDPLLEVISGSVSNVIGLPMESLKALVATF